MIKSHDRSGWFGASDTKFIIGNWDTKSFKEWWYVKLGLKENSFYNAYTMAGTYYEHKILDCVNPIMEKDKQIIIPELRLRVNLDGNTDKEIFEVKTYKEKNGFRLLSSYKYQILVQGFASGIRDLNIVSYPLNEENYKNFFLPVEKEKINILPVDYDEDFINNKYLPRLIYLKGCLERGVMPSAA